MMVEADTGIDRHAIADREGIARERRAVEKDAPMCEGGLVTTSDGSPPTSRNRRPPE